MSKSNPRLIGGTGVEHAYHITHKIKAHPNGISKDEVLADEEMGACDEILLASIIKNEAGASSTLFITRNGAEDRPFTPFETFRVWALLAAHLKETLPEGDGRHAIVSAAHEMVSDMLAEMRKGN